jgi:hypothetical protein
MINNDSKEKMTRTDEEKAAWLEFELIGRELFSLSEQLEQITFFEHLAEHDALTWRWGERDCQMVRMWWRAGPDATRYGYR